MPTTDTVPVTQPGTAVKPGPIAWFAGNPVAANLLMLFFIVGGIIAGTHLAVQHFPPLDLRTVTVTVPFPGASPREVEEDVNRRIEESVIGLAGVERVVGTATQGLGRISIELSTFADPTSVLNDVQTAVAGIENFPPVTADHPEVELQQLALEVMTLAVSSTAVSENGLRLAAENLRDELLELPSISQVKLKGTRDREISIELSEEELRRHNLTFNEISNAVQRASLNLTFGELRTDAGGVVLQTVSKRRFGEEFKDIPLITRLDGTIVTLGDVAEIRDGFVDEDVVTRFNGQPTVLVRIDATETQSVVGMAREIRNWLESYDPAQDVTVSIWSDRAQPSLDRLSAIIRNGVIGAILVFLSLVLLFDLRIATWVTVGIPLSFIGSLLFFGPADLTLNMGTIFGFFLMVGIVVDDAVVVGESIAAERERGKRSLDAAISGARAVVGPITVGVVTTILGFLPFLFITTTNYQIVNVFPWVAFSVLLVSLIEAFFILPAHLSHEKRWSAPPLSDLQDLLRDRLDGVRDRVVVPAVSWSVRNITLTLACAVLVVIAAVWLLRSETVRVIMIDKDANLSGNVQADLALPIGAPFDATLATAERFVTAGHAVNEQLGGTAIQSISIVVGNTAATRLRDKEEQNGSHLASVRLHLHDRPVRTESPADIERLWRRHVGDVSYLEKVEYQTTRVQDRPTVAYAVKHHDARTLVDAATELRSFMSGMSGIYEISDSLSLGKRHFEIQLTPAGKAAGLTPASLGKQLRANFNGAVVQRIQRGHDEVKVMVRYPTERRRSLSELANERIIRPAGGGLGGPGAGAYTEVPLSTVARLTEKRGLATLTRIDGKQAAIVNGRADTATITPLQARRQIGEEIIPDLLETYPGLKIEIHGAARDTRAILETLGLTVPLALLAMYALMAAFLRSYWKPLVAVVGIPIAFAGAVLGHWILGWDFTAMSLFGVIGVAGVVVNDALVLMDRYNTIRRDNDAIPAIAAVSAATRHRFRAVLLTSLTTVLGLSPLLYERSDELLFLVPLVVSMLGGLVLSGVFILFILPTLVMLAEGRHE
ncbi:MAG: efflux RND transporter permease subunit [Thiotrichales bacterium]|nr:efflux RND transporter permease subunit [Thiotrichales bacterium]